MSSFDASPSQNDSVLDAEKLKKIANEYFAQKKYKEAEDTYTLALNGECPNELKSVLLANRSAARIGLHMYELALSDAEESIRLNNSWMKAYYRKSAALEGMGKFRQALETWEDAFRNCPPDPSIDKQLRALQKKWMSCFLQPTYPIESDVDLLSRYALLADRRERLSTLAHFWNDSTQHERYSFFLLLMSLIGGETGLSRASLDMIVPEAMIDMPLHNYPDLPRERIQLWCDYFKGLSPENKRTFFQAIWNKILTSDEQNDVISDLKLLMSQPSGTTINEVD
jgi:tetratricopeptide (TPR) repeat protein